MFYPYQVAVQDAASGIIYGQPPPPLPDLKMLTNPHPILGAWNACVAQAITQLNLISISASIPYPSGSSNTLVSVIAGNGNVTTGAGTSAAFIRPSIKPPASIIGFLREWGVTMTQIFQSINNFNNAPWGSIDVAGIASLPVGITGNTGGQPGIMKPDIKCPDSIPGFLSEFGVLIAQVAARVNALQNQAISIINGFPVVGAQPAPFDMGFK